MRFLHDNEIDKYTPTVSSEQGNFPAENVQDTQLIMTWRTNSLTGQYLKIDAGEGKTITATCAAIVAHNLTSSATIKIQANATDSWGGTPSVDESFSYDAAIMVRFFTSAAYRFWRFYFDDATNPDAYIEIGRLVLCVYYQLDEFPSGDLKDRPVDTSVASFSISEQMYSDIGIQYQVYEIDLGILEDATRANLKTAVAVVGKHKPLVVLLDENNTAKLPALYCAIETELEFDHVGGWGWKGGMLRFREVF